MGVPWGSLIFRQSHMGVSYGDTLKSSKSLDHFSIETYGFRDPPILRHPHMFFLKYGQTLLKILAHLDVYHFFGILPIYDQFLQSKSRWTSRSTCFFLHFFSNKGHFGVHLHRPACVVGWPRLHQDLRERSLPSPPPHQAFPLDQCGAQWRQLSDCECKLRVWK